MSSGPLRANHIFGYVNDADSKIECWFKNQHKTYWAILYGLVVIAMVLSSLLFIIAIYIRFQSNTNNANCCCNNQLITKLFAFVLVFVITWIFPLIDRATSEPQFWLSVFHHCFLTIYGFGNAIVWFGFSREYG